MKSRRLFKDKKSLIISIVVFLVVAIGVTAICIILHNNKLYTDANNEQAKADDMRDMLVYGKQDGVIVINPPDKNNMDSESEDSNMIERVNFDRLSKFDKVVSDDVFGWIYVPGTTIDYIVMQGTRQDSYKYLWRNPDGFKSKTGSLFVRYMADDDVKDAHTVIYGHRLKDHSLYFGALFEYKDPRYACDHNYAYLYKKDSVIKYELCSIHQGMDKDAVYFYPYELGSEEYEWMVDSIEDTMTFHLKDFDKRKEMLVLSTCSGARTGQPYRMYLVFEKMEEKAY